MTESKVSVLAKSAHWRIWGRNFSTPNLTEVSHIEGTDDFQTRVTLAEVFAEMELDLAALSQIFVKSPWQFYLAKAAERETQATAADYSELEMCRIWDHEGWSALAQLIKKKITLMHLASELDAVCVATIYPTGKIELINPREPERWVSIP